MCKCTSIGYVNLRKSGRSRTRNKFRTNYTVLGFQLSWYWGHRLFCLLHMWDHDLVIGPCEQLPERLSSQIFPSWISWCSFWALSLLTILVLVARNCQNYSKINKTFQSEYQPGFFLASHMSSTYCCDRSNSSNNNYGNNNHQQPSAPPQPQHVVTMTSPTAPVQGVTQPELEMSLLKLQNQVMLQQLNAQGNQHQPQQAQAGGDGRGDINQLLALGLNRYPVVWRSKGQQQQEP